MVQGGGEGGWVYAKTLLFFKKKNKKISVGVSTEVVQLSHYIIILFSLRMKFSSVVFKWDLVDRVTTKRLGKKNAGVEKKKKKAFHGLLKTRARSVKRQPPPVSPRRIASALAITERWSDVS